MHTIAKTFDDLSTRELYEFLQLRAAVFIVEQDCPYQDLDGKDQEALHVLGKEGNLLVAYTRIFGPGAYFEEASIGRVVTAESARGKGYGKQIMEVSIRTVEERFRTRNITLSAQSYLVNFYRELGFVETGEEYLEDGIPHIKMVRH